jgi:superfamily II DNA or RNA helicase
VASGTIAKFGVPTLFIAHQLDLIYDAKNVFNKFIDGVGEIGVIGGGECNYKPLTVACIDSLANKINDYTMQTYLREKVKYVIVDETQFYGPGEYKKVLNQCNAPYRIFMSATVERNDGADLEITAGSGRMIYSLTEGDMIQEGYISDVDIEMIPFDQGLHNEHATGIVYHKFYDQFIVQNEERNALVIDEVKKLLDSGNPTLVIVRRIDHGHLLKEMLISAGVFKVEFIWGEVDAKERIKLREAFNRGEFDVLIGSTIFDTAIDLHRASGLVLAASGNSKIRAPQRVGRVLSQVMGKVAKVKDIKDLNIKYFARDANDRQRVYIGRYGDKRVKVRGVGSPSEIEQIFGINTSRMFDNLR